MDLKDYPILYVDDERANRVVMKHNLSKQFSLLIADSAEAALKIMAAESVAVLLTDQRMPKVTGVDLAEQVLRDYPDVVRVIITAYSDLDATIDAINRARVNRFIKKPWTREELVAVMRESIQAFDNARLLKKMQARLLQLDRVTTVAVMASAIAHDLRQPLAYIGPTLDQALSDARLLEEITLSPEGANAKVARIREGLEDIDQGVDKFEIISSTLLKSLRTQNDGLELIELRRVIEGALAMTRTTILSRALLKIELPQDDAYAMAAEGKILQVIFNLLLNAVDAIEPDQKMANQIRVTLTPVAESWRIVVQDSGCGIPAEEQDRVFAPFYTTKGEVGTGLGLPICSQLVEELGGALSFESIPGEGSRFIVDLPQRMDRGSM